jgi:hypothetical protein
MMFLGLCVVAITIYRWATPDFHLIDMHERPLWHRHKTAFLIGETLIALSAFVTIISGVSWCLAAWICSSGRHDRLLGALPLVSTIVVLILFVASRYLLRFLRRTVSFAWRCWQIRRHDRRMQQQPVPPPPPPPRELTPEEQAEMVRLVEGG